MGNASGARKKLVPNPTGLRMMTWARASADEVQSKVGAAAQALADSPDENQAAVLKC
jgi:hypothetical protein